MRMTTKATNVMDLSGFNFYQEKGCDFDVSAFELAYDVKLTEKNIKFVNEKLNALKNKYLLISFVK